MQFFDDPRRLRLSGMAAAAASAARVGPKNGIALTSPHPVRNLPLVCPN